MDTETDVKSETDYKYLKNLDLEITSNDTLLSGSRSAKDPVPEDIASMVKFDMMQSSRPVDLAATTINQGFLTSTANWEGRNTRNIYVRMPKVDHICQVINE